jgi:hypothetical protein
MPSVELNDQQWGQVMSILSDAPWKVANPLLMAIGDQLRAQFQASQSAQQQQQPPMTTERAWAADGNNSKEARHE